jgi:hypothetical protein
MKTRQFLTRSLTAACLASAGLAQAAPVIWADWISGTAGPSGSATGTFATPTPITISYSGEIQFIQTTPSTYYYTGNPSPYVSAAVDNAPPLSDIIALSRASSKTLSFSVPIDNLFFAVVSLNGNGYEFDEDFTIMTTSSTCGYWGCGSLSKQDMGNGKFRLIGTGEPHNVIRFNRAVSSITWTSLTNENWNGFTVGTYGVAPPPIPEPGTYALMALGLGAVGLVARRRSR